jgi:hypothetical protein
VLHDGVAVDDAVAVGVAVDVLVAVLVEVFVGAGLGVPVGVFVAVPVGPQLSVVICSAQPPLMLPISICASSRTYRAHVPFGFVPLNTANAAPPAGAGAGAGNASEFGS